MSVPQYSSNDQVSHVSKSAIPTPVSTGNVQNVQLAPSHHNKVPNNHATERQLLIQQASHSQRSSRALPANVEYSSPSDDLQLAWIQNPHYNAPVTPMSSAINALPEPINTSANSQQKVAIQNMQDQVTFANRLVLEVNASGQNSNLQIQSQPSSNLSSPTSLDKQKHGSLKFECRLAKPPRPMLPVQCQQPMQLQLRQQPVQCQQFIQIQQPINIQQPAQLQPLLLIQKPVLQESPVQHKHLANVQTPLQCQQPVQSQQLADVQQSVQHQLPVQGQHQVHIQQAVQLKQPVEIQNPMQRQQSVQFQQPVQIQQPFQNQKAVQQPMQHQQHGNSKQQIQQKHAAQHQQLVQQAIQHQQPVQQKQAVQHQQAVQQKQAVQHQQPVQQKQAVQHQQAVQQKHAAQHQQLVQQAIQHQQPVQQAIQHQQPVQQKQAVQHQQAVQQKQAVQHQQPVQQKQAVQHQQPVRQNQVQHRQPVVEKESVRHTNKHLHNQQSFLSGMQSTLLIGSHQSQHTTPEKSCPNVNCYNMKGIENTALLLYDEKCKPSDIFEFFECNEADSNISNETHATIPENTSRTQQEVDATTAAPSKQSPQDRMSVQGTYSVVGSVGVNNGIKDSLGQSLHSISCLSGTENPQIAEKELYELHKHMLNARECYLIHKREYREKWRLFKKSDLNDNVSSSNLEGSSVVHMSLDNSHNGSSSQMIPHISSSPQSPPFLTHQNVLNPNKTSQERTPMDQTSKASVQERYRSENVHKASPPLANAASFEAWCRNELEALNHVISNAGETPLYSKPKNGSTVKRSQGKCEQSKALADVNQNNRSELVQKQLTTGGESNFHYLIGNQSTLTDRQTDVDTKLQSCIQNKKQNGVFHVQDSPRCPLITKLLTEENTNVEKSAQGPTIVPYTNDNNIEAVSSTINLPSSNSNIPIYKGDINVTGSQLTETPFYQEGSNSVEALESLCSLRKLSLSIIDTQKEQLHDAYIETKQRLPCQDHCDQKAMIVSEKPQQTEPAYKPSNAASSMSEANHCLSLAVTTVGYKHETLGTNGMKAIEPQIAVVNPLMLAKSNCSTTDQSNVSLDTHTHLGIQEGSMSSLSEQNKQNVMENVPDSENTDYLSVINELLAVLHSDVSMKCADNVEMDTVIEISNSRIVNPTKSEQCLENTKNIKSPIYLENSEPSKPQESLSTQPESAPVTHKLTLGEVVYDDHGQKMHSSQMCTLGKGNTLYDSDITQISDCIPLKQRVYTKTLNCVSTISATKEMLESSTIKHTCEKEVLPLLMDVHCFSENKTKSDVPHSEVVPSRKNEHRLIEMLSDINASPFDLVKKESDTCSDPSHGPNQTHLDTWTKEKGTVDLYSKLNEDGFAFKEVTCEKEDACSISKPKDPEEHANFIADQIIEDNHSLKIVSSEREGDGSVNKEKDQEEHLLFTDDQINEVSECDNGVQHINSQLFELIREFPYGLQIPGSKNAWKENRVIEKKDLDKGNLEMNKELQTDKQEHMYSQVWGSEKERSMGNDLETSDFTEEKTEARFVKKYTISSPSVCDFKKEESLIQTCGECDSEDKMTLQLDNNFRIFPQDICDSECEDASTQIKMTLLDHDQIRKLFPDIYTQSSFDAITECSQHMKQVTTEPERKMNLDSPGIDESSLTVSESTCANQPSSAKRECCCLHDWLPSGNTSEPQCLCECTKEKINAKGYLNPEDTNCKVGENNTIGGNSTFAIGTSSKPENDANKLSVKHEGINQQQSDTQGSDVKPITADGGISQTKAEPKLTEQKLCQPSDKKGSEICKKKYTFEKQMNKRRLHTHHVYPDISRKTEITDRFKIKTSEHDTPKKDLPIKNCNFAKLENNSLCKDLQAENYNKKQGHLVQLSKAEHQRKGFNIKTLFLKSKCPTSSTGIKHGETKGLDQTNSDANRGKFYNNKSENVISDYIEEKSTFSSDSFHTKNTKKLPSSEHFRIEAELNIREKEKVPVKKLLSTEKTCSAKEMKTQGVLLKDSNIKEIHNSQNQGTNMVQDKHLTFKAQKCRQRCNSEPISVGEKTPVEETEQNKTKQAEHKKDNINLAKCVRQSGGTSLGENLSTCYTSSETMARHKPNPETFKRRLPNPEHIKPCGSPNKGKPTNYCFSDDQHKSGHMIVDKCVTQSPANAARENIKANKKRKMSAPGKDPKESSKGYLSTDASKSHKQETVSPTELKTVSSTGISGDKRSGKVFEAIFVKETKVPISQNVSKEERMLELKMRPEVQLRGHSAEKGSTSGITSPVNEKHSIKGQAKIASMFKDNTSQNESPKKHLPTKNCNPLKVRTNSVCKDFPAGKYNKKQGHLENVSGEKKKIKGLVVKADCLKSNIFTSSSEIGQRKTKGLDQNIIDASTLNLHKNRSKNNIGVYIEEKNTYSSDSLHTKKSNKLPNSEDIKIKAEMNVPEKEKVPMKKLLSKDKLCAVRSIEPQSAPLKDSDITGINNSKNHHANMDEDKKLSFTAEKCRQRCNSEPIRVGEKTPVEGTKQSKTNQLGHKRDHIHLKKCDIQSRKNAKLETGSSAGISGEKRAGNVSKLTSVKNIKVSISQNDTGEERMLFLGLGPQLLLRGHSAQKISTGGVTLNVTEKIVVEGNKNKTDYCGNNIPVKKKKVDLTEIQANIFLPDSLMLKQSTSTPEKRTILPEVRNSKAKLQPHKKSYSQTKRKSLAGTTEQ